MRQLMLAALTAIGLGLSALPAHAQSVIVAPSTGVATVQYYTPYTYGSTAYYSYPNTTYYSSPYATYAYPYTSNYVGPTVYEPGYTASYPYYGYSYYYPGYTTYRPYRWWR